MGISGCRWYRNVEVDMEQLRRLVFTLMFMCISLGCVPVVFPNVHSHESFLFVIEHVHSGCIPQCSCVFAFGLFV